MKKQLFNKLIATVFIASLGFGATSAIASPDFFQQQINQQLMQSRQKLKAAEAAKVSAEQQKLMSEHMKAMHEVMEKMQALKPKAGITMQEHEEWINEHLKLMDQMVDQLMDEHHVLMGSGNTHKH
ncbi:MAG: hypothetical protein WC696_00470 [Candidatus Methylopumilus sp.]|jgi:stalled ribosome rescue protein Dom34